MTTALQLLLEDDMKERQKILSTTIPSIGAMKPKQVVSTKTSKSVDVGGCEDEKQGYNEAAPIACTESFRVGPTGLVHEKSSSPSPWGNGKKTEQDRRNQQNEHDEEEDLDGWTVDSSPDEDDDQPGAYSVAGSWSAEEQPCSSCPLDELEIGMEIEEESHENGINRSSASDGEEQTPERNYSLVVMVAEVIDEDAIRNRVQQRLKERMKRLFGFNKNYQQHIGNRLLRNKTISR